MLLLLAVGLTDQGEKFRDFTCEQDCNQGTCTAPNVCTCDAGYVTVHLFTKTYYCIFPYFLFIPPSPGSWIFIGAAVVFVLCGWGLWFVLPRIHECLARKSRGSGGQDQLLGNGAAPRNDPAPSPDRPARVDPNSIGVALSGGGIRSALICLGAMTKLQGVVTNTEKRIGIISSVSGGGYLASALMAARTLQPDMTGAINEVSRRIERNVCYPAPFPKCEPCCEGCTGFLQAMWSRMARKGNSPFPDDCACWEVCKGILHIAGICAGVFVTLVVVPLIIATSIGVPVALVMDLLFGGYVCQCNEDNHPLYVLWPVGFNFLLAALALLVVKWIFRPVDWRYRRYRCYATEPAVTWVYNQVYIILDLVQFFTRAIVGMLFWIAVGAEFEKGYVEVVVQVAWTALAVILSVVQQAGGKTARFFGETAVLWYWARISEWFMFGSRIDGTQVAHQYFGSAVIYVWHFQATLCMAFPIRIK